MNSITKKTIIACPYCATKTRVPVINKKIVIHCPRCARQFPYKHSYFQLSPGVKLSMLAGLCGGAAGFAITEILSRLLFNRVLTVPLQFLSLFVTFSVLGLSIGAFLGGSEGFFLHNKKRMLYGVKMGVILGAIGGTTAGLLAQLVFSFILQSSPDAAGGLTTSLARIVGWAVFGTLLGVAYGIKENTIGDLKSGAIAGAIGGAIGGALFDPLATIGGGGTGALSRAIGFIILGMCIGAAVKYLQEQSVVNDKPEMFKTLTYRLPANMRLE